MVRQRQPDPRRAARRRSRKSASCAIARRKQELELAPLETRLIPVSYAQAEELQARAKDLLSPRGSHRRRRAHQRAHRARRRRQPEPHRGARSLARHADAAGARRSAHRRSDEPLPARRRHPVGRRRDVQRRRPATRRASRSRRRVGVAGGAYDSNTPTAGLSPFTRTVAEPELRRQPPGRGRHRATAARSASRFGSIDNTFNLARAPLGRRVERHAPHRLEPAHPHARQPRSAHQPGHADPVLAGQRARRSDHVPGSEAAAPRASRTSPPTAASRCT